MPDDYAAANLRAEECNSVSELPSSLDDLVNMYPKGDTAQCEVRVAVEDVLKNMLHPDGEQRLSPFKPLRQPFSTRSHLTELSDSRDEMTPSQMKTNLCPMEEPGQESDTGFYDTTPATSCKEEDSVSRTSDGQDLCSNHDDTSVWSSDGEDLCSNDRESVSWYPDGLDHQPSEEDLATRSTDGRDLCSNDEDSAVGSFEERDLCSSDDDVVSWPSAEVTETNSSVGASSGRPVKLLKRIQRFCSRIRTTLCCCWRPSVED
ncbi:uncharacterized protein LOC129349994 [Amphiprion ocellaris]|uniref:uncharacterized protein LOC129349994 n=1 Tax=Amphiprion ocellaris TaxID=80972 RepID=UPI00241128B4|nr:uncharacterized protein LOC129349994 [Amphiprion ocellaris]